MPSAHSLAVGLSTLLVIGLVGACADDGGGYGPRPAAHEAPQPTGEAEGPCQDGATRKCKVVIGEHDGVLTCFVGTEVCDGGEWGECGDVEEGLILIVDSLKLADPADEAGTP